MKDVLIKFNVYTKISNENAKTKSESMRVNVETKEHEGRIMDVIKVKAGIGCQYSIDGYLVKELGTNKCFKIDPSDILEFK